MAGTRTKTGWSEAQKAAARAQLAQTRQAQQSTGREGVSQNAATGQTGGARAVLNNPTQFSPQTQAAAINTANRGAQQQVQATGVMPGQAAPPGGSAGVGPPMSGEFAYVGPYGFHNMNYGTAVNNPELMLQHMMPGYNGWSPGAQAMQNLPFDPTALARLGALGTVAGGGLNSMDNVLAGIQGVYQGVQNGQWIDPRAAMNMLMNPQANSDLAVQMATMTADQQAQYIQGMAGQIANATMDPVSANAFRAALGQNIQNAMASGLTQNPTTAGWNSLLANQLGGNVFVDAAYMPPGWGLNGVPTAQGGAVPGMIPQGPPARR